MLSVLPKVLLLLFKNSHSDLQTGGCSLGAPFLRVRVSLPELWADMFEEAKEVLQCPRLSKTLQPSACLPHNVGSSYQARGQKPACFFVSLVCIAPSSARP